MNSLGWASELRRVKQQRDKTAALLSKLNGEFERLRTALRHACDCREGKNNCKTCAAAFKRWGEGGDE